MLPSFYREYDRDTQPRIEKTVAAEDASNRGAFSFGTQIELCVHTPRALGACGVVLRIARDGGEDRDLALSFVRTQDGIDTYRLTLDTAALCQGEDSGLFYYEFLFLRGWHTLFTNSVNNVDFILTEHSASRFRLLVYTSDFSVPHWFFGGTMYHIFVDRFCRGQGHAPLRAGATLDPDWDNGIPQYNAYPGAPLANDRFFGGNLWGVIERLDYLRSLGVTVLYLSPIFDAASNHKYDTGDYETVDAAFGGEQALGTLIKQAKAYGMRVILDGVFNHTGDDSRYFNRYGHYASTGAYQSENSPYAHWYHFSRFPTEYDCWWNIPILPRLCGANPEVIRYLAGQDGIAATRVRQGIAGWRLDVADELSDEFLDTLRTSLHAAAPDPQEPPVIIGEVWENAADKIAYGRRRRYFGGRQLDSVMNYPLRNGILALARDGDAEALYHTLTELYGSYPAPVCHALMNLLGTHDTERILTVLGDEQLGDGRTNDELAHARLSPAQYERAVSRLMLAQTVLFTVFGIPSVFYGDEVGMQGHHDPFCRKPFPWGREDERILGHVRFLGRLRRENDCFLQGDFRVIYHDSHALVYERRSPKSAVITAVNAASEPLELPLTGRWELLTPGGVEALEHRICVPAGQAILIREVLV